MTLINTIKYHLGMWISYEYDPPKEGEYLVLGEYGIANLYYTRYGFGGDGYVGGIEYWKKISGLPNDSTFGKCNLNN